MPWCTCHGLQLLPHRALRNDVSEAGRVGDGCCMVLGWSKCLTRKEMHRGGRDPQEAARAGGLGSVRVPGFALVVHSLPRSSLHGMHVSKK